MFDSSSSFNLFFRYGKMPNVYRVGVSELRRSTKEQIAYMLDDQSFLTLADIHNLEHVATGLLEIENVSRYVIDEVVDLVQWHDWRYVEVW